MIIDDPFGGHLSYRSSDKTHIRSLASVQIIKLISNERGSCMVWEINIGVCPRLDFENITLFNCLGYNFNINGAFQFLCNAIANL